MSAKPGPPANPHDGRYCTVCGTALDVANSHCPNKVCPWCQDCVRRGRPKR